MDIRYLTINALLIAAYDGSKILTSNLEDGLCKTSDVRTRDTSNTDSSILGRIDAVFRRELVHLLLCKSSVGEHADLVGDMVPVVLAAQLLEVLLEECAHGDDAVSHTLDLTQPLLVESWVVEDGAGDTSSVNRWVRVERSDEDLDLRVDSLLLICVCADDGECTDTFTVQTHVLGETLGKTDLVTLLEEVPHSVGVLVCVTTCESLVCHIEEWEVLSLLDSLTNRMPLLLRWVDTSRVVRTSV